MQGAQARCADDDMAALMQGFLEVGANGAAAGDVIVATQKFAGVAHLFTFITDCAFFRHTR